MIGYRARGRLPQQATQYESFNRTIIKLSEGTILQPCVFNIVVNVAHQPDGPPCCILARVLTQPMDGQAIMPSILRDSQGNTMLRCGLTSSGLSKITVLDLAFI